MHQAQKEADLNFDMPLSSVAWFHMRVGDLLAQRGRAKEAESAYREALALFPCDYRTLTALARLRQDREIGRPCWTGRQIRSDCAHSGGGRPAGDAYCALGKPKQAEEQYALVETIAKLAKRRERSTTDSAPCSAPIINAIWTKP